jgi:hypothetical protein
MIETHIITEDELSIENRHKITGNNTHWRYFTHISSLRWVASQNVPQNQADIITDLYWDHNLRVHL